MAHHLHHPQQQQPALFPSDDLYCSEEDLFFDQPEHDPPLQEITMSWEDDELISLLSKESLNYPDAPAIDPSLRTAAREDAVDWILKSRARYGFSALTAVLAVDYLDRFLVNFPGYDEPWAARLTAVACLSIAAKVDEVHVPALLDLQEEEESELYFKAKDVQNMELTVLSALRWKMNPATVVSFLDYIARRLEMEHHFCSEFLTRCEPIVLSLISDLRYTIYKPSVMATAVTLHVLQRLCPLLVQDYQTQLFTILDLQMDNVEACRKLVMECLAGGSRDGYGSKKRKFGLGSGSVPGSPNGVLDICFSPESEGSWAAADEPNSKRMRLID